MTALRSVLASAIMLGWAGAAAAYDQLPRSLARMTPTEVAERIHIDDDALEPYIVVSTEPAWDRGRRIEGAHATDVHMRALIDRHSGAVRWQVWHDLIYRGEQSDVVGVSYRAGGRLEQTGLVRTEQWYDDCPGTDAAPVSCSKHTRFVFEIPGTVVEEIAGAYRPESRAPWRLSFRDEHGSAITGGLAPAEAAGLLQAVERVRAQTGSND